MNIDIHHHAVPDTLLRFIRENPGATRKEYRTIAGRECLVYADNQFVQPIYPVYYDDEIRFRKMDQMGIDMAVLSISPAHFNYELDASVAAETSRIINDWMGRKQSEHPERYRGMMTLPMQDPVAALVELERAHTAYGLKGLEIAAQVLDSNLDDPRLFPIFAYCADHGIVVCLHPYFATVDPMFSRYYTTNLVRFPLQTCMGIVHLMLGGVLERLQNLKVIAYHGGGHFPYQFGRLEHGYVVRSEPKDCISKEPAEYLRQIYFDTITHSTPALQFLADTFGVDHVLIGTDMPYDMGDLCPVQTVNSLRLTASERAAICSGNAVQLFGIE